MKRLFTDGHPQGVWKPSIVTPRPPKLLKRKGGHPEAGSHKPQKVSRLVPEGQQTRPHHLSATEKITPSMQAILVHLNYKLHHR